MDSEDPIIQMQQALIESTKAAVLKEIRILQDSPPKVKGIFSRIGNRLFNWNLRQRPGETPQWKKPADNMIDRVEANRLTPAWLSLPTDRIGLYDVYDDLDNYDLVAGLLQAFADAATQMSQEHKRVVWCEGAVPKLEKEILDFLDRLDVEHIIEPLAYDLGKYGDDFCRLLYKEGEGVYSLRWEDPRSIERVENEDSILLGFMPIDVGQSMRVLQDVDEENLFQPWDVVHFRIMTSKFARLSERADAYYYGGSNAMYGTSLLKNARRVGKQLRFLEELLIIFRLTHAVDKHIYYVDTGTDADAVHQISVMNRWKAALKRRDYTNPDTNEFDAVYNPQNLVEDIFWPVRGSESQSKVDVRPGIGDVGEAVDVDFFLSKLHASLGIPREYSGFEGQGNFDATKPLTSQSVRFSRAVERLQKAVLAGLTRMVDIHLAFRGYKIEDYLGKYRLAMVNVSGLEQLAKLDAQQLKISNTKDALELGEMLGLDAIKWRVHLMKSTMGMSDDDIRELAEPSEATEAAHSEDELGQAADGGHPDNPHEGEPGEENLEDVDIESDDFDIDADQSSDGDEEETKKTVLGDATQKRLRFHMEGLKKKDLAKVAEQDKVDASELYERALVTPLPGIQVSDDMTISRISDKERGMKKNIREAYNKSLDKRRKRSEELKEQREAAAKMESEFLISLYNVVKAKKKVKR